MIWFLLAWVAIIVIGIRWFHVNVYKDPETPSCYGDYPFRYPFREAERCCHDCIMQRSCTLISSPMVLTADDIDHLEDAIQQAEEDDGIVRYCAPPRPRFGVAKVTHTLSLEEAYRLRDDGKAALAANPMPVFPENREGREP